jgi:hypothetical protein
VNSSRALIVFDRDSATDLLWALTSAETFQRLAATGRWSTGRYQTWLGQTFIDQLLPTDHSGADVATPP